MILIETSPEAAFCPTLSAAQKEFESIKKALLLQ